MTRSRLHYVLPLLCIAAEVAAFETFEAETERLDAAIGCEDSRVRRASPKWSAQYSCLGGVANNVELIVTERLGTGEVSEVSLTWSDWRQDTGYGIRPSRKLAQKWAKAIATIYAPGELQEISAAFSSNKDLEIETNEHRIQFTYRIGPSIDERKLTITEKND